jgi:hypothetical protein
MGGTLCVRSMFKGTQQLICFTFFAETETSWSTYKHFCVCSASDEIHSEYAQCAMKFVPSMLSKNCSHYTAG